MKRLERLAAVPLVTAVGIAATACAPIYGPRPSVYGTSLRPAVGAWAGPALTADVNVPGLAGRPDLGLTVETPVTADLIVRGQISRMWGLTDSAGVPPVSHDLTLRHLAADIVWPWRPVNSSGLTSYGEFGFGWYFYDAVGRRGTNGHAKGLHGGGGIECPISGRRFTVNGEVQVHVMDLPPTNLAPVFVRLLGGMKVRF